MIIKRTITKDKDGTLIECVINSSNILKTDYFVHNKKLFVYFNRGHCYSYYNVDENTYNEFENAKSQGEYLRQNIMNNLKFPYAKEFKLSEREITESKNIIEEWKENQSDHQI